MYVPERSLTLANTIPVQKGDQIELTIGDLSHDGQGVGHYQGFTIFVPQALPGERVQVKIISTQKAYARGLVERPLLPASNRQTPVCNVFGKCGGCQLQHLPYQDQLAFKQRVVEQSLARIGKIKGATVHSTLGMENPWNYRNKAEIPFGFSGGKTVAGFYAPRSHQIIDIPGCHIQHSLINQVFEAVRDLVQKHQLSTYNEKTGKGLLRHLFARVAVHTGEVMVVLVGNGTKLPNEGPLVSELQKMVPQITSVGLSINTGKTNGVLGNKFRLLAGKEYLTDYIGPFAFDISHRSFFQVNPTQTEVLYNKVLEYAQLAGAEEVVDAYCGVGTIALFLSQRAKGVIGIETVSAAVADAERNAQRNGVDNVKFMSGAVEEVLPQLLKKGYRPDVIVTDPPRKGCAASALDTFVHMQPRRIVYVSCNPTTLARDLGYLAERGYETVEVQPVDMFPQTSHIECVTLMSRVKE